MIDLVSIERSTKHPYKYTAVFSVSNGRKITHFGHRAYEDFTIHLDPQRRFRYRSRHRKDLETNDPTRA
eukprot:6031973-Pleurochrysis_carterae.AAC.1